MTSCSPSTGTRTVGDTLAYTTCRAASLELLQLIIGMGLAVDATIPTGVSPHDICATTGALPLVEALVWAPADVILAGGPVLTRLSTSRSRKTTFDSPLHAASIHIHAAMVANLVRKGATGDKTCELTVVALLERVVLRPPD